jgi:hypothetical protein
MGTNCVLPARFDPTFIAKLLFAEEWEKIAPKDLD